MKRRILDERQTEQFLIKPYRSHIRQFHKMFPFNKFCKIRLFKWKWPNGYICEKCGNDEYYYHNNRNLYQCKNAKCKYQASLTAGTIFHKSRTPLIVWFYIIFVIGLSNNNKWLPLSHFIQFREKFVPDGNHYKPIHRIIENIEQLSKKDMDNYLLLVKYF